MSPTSSGVRCSWSSSILYIIYRDTSYEGCLLDILIHIPHNNGTASQCKHSNHAAGAPTKKAGCTLEPSQINKTGNKISSIISHPTIIITKAGPCSLSVSINLDGSKCSILCLSLCLIQFQIFLNYISCFSHYNRICSIIGFWLRVTKLGVFHMKGTLVLQKVF